MADGTKKPVLEYEPDLSARILAPGRVPEAEELELIRLANREALFTDDEYELITVSNYFVQPWEARRAVGEALDAGDEETLEGFRELSRDPGFRVAWEERHRGKRQVRLTRPERHQRMLLSLKERSWGAAVEEFEDPEVLMLASEYRCGAGLTRLRAGMLLMEPALGDGFDAEFEESLRALPAQRREHRLNALELGLAEADIECLQWAMDLEELWSRDRGLQVRGVEPRDEALVRIGRKVTEEDPDALVPLLEAARKARSSFEAWEEDRNWSRDDTRILAGVLECTFQEAAIRIARVERLEDLRRFRQEVDLMRHVAEWTEPDDIAVFRMHWGLPDGQVRERIERHAADGDRGLLRLRAERDAAGEKACAAYVRTLEGNGSWTDAGVSTLVNAGFARTRQTMKELAGALTRAGDEDRLDALERELAQLETRGHFSTEFLSSNYAPADVAELADGENTSLQEMIGRIEEARTVPLQARTVALEEESLYSKPRRDSTAGALAAPETVSALRSAQGRDREACLAAFQASPTWWEDDAEAVVELREIPPVAVHEYMGHRLLAGRHDDLRRQYIWDRIEEQSLARAEDTSHPYVVLVLQGGGAKAAYQVGVYEALRSEGLEPSWVLGISSGALNASVIAGNPVSRRMEKLDRLWSKLANPFVSTAQIPSNLRSVAKVWGALASIPYKPNFYRPHGLPPAFFPPGSEGATSLFTSEPLRKLVDSVVDFERLDREGEIHRNTTFARRHRRAAVRLTLGVTETATGKGVWFHNTDGPLTAGHVVASGALPPGAPGVSIDGRLYWDGGVVGNNPLEPVLDEMIEGTLNGREVLVVVVDLWSSDDWEPRSLPEVRLRLSQLDFMGRVDASMATFRTRLLLELERRRSSEKRVSSGRGRVRRPRYGTIDPRSLTILRVEDGRWSGVGSLDPMDFSKDSIGRRRAFGASDTRAALESLRREEVAPDEIGGIIHRFRRGELLSRTEAVDIDPAG